MDDITRNLPDKPTRFMDQFRVFIKFFVGGCPQCFSDFSVGVFSSGCPRFLRLIKLTSSRQTQLDDVEDEGGTSR